MKSILLKVIRNKAVLPEAIVIEILAVLDYIGINNITGIMKRRIMIYVKTKVDPFSQHCLRSQTTNEAYKKNKKNIPILMKREFRKMKPEVDHNIL